MRERINVLCNGDYVRATRRVVREQHADSGTGVVTYMHDEHAALCIDGQWTIDVCARKQHAWDEVLRVRQEFGYPDYGPNMDSGYGYPNVASPLDFSPDPECATAQELENWVDAVQRFNAGEDYQNLQPFTIHNYHGEMHLHISRTSWGLGVNFYRPSSFPQTQTSGYWLHNVGESPQEPSCPHCNENEPECRCLPGLPNMGWHDDWAERIDSGQIGDDELADLFAVGTEALMRGQV